MSAAVEGTGDTLARPLQAVVPLWMVLALAGSVAWVVTTNNARAMGTGPGTMGLALPLFAGMWLAMMAAMMLPAIGPMAAGKPWTGRRVWPARVPPVLAFGAGFLVPWATYGLLAFFALLGTDRLVEASPEAATWLGVGILATAGVWQFTPWKRRSLEHCRMTAHRPGGLLRNLRAGIGDGAVCVVCCWALMAVLIAAGVMNLPAMAGLAGVIFAEKILPGPRVTSALAGVALIALGVGAAFFPAMLPGLTMPDMPMAVGGM
jgi:predicted metal-binding membrane protein